MTDTRNTSNNNVLIVSLVFFASVVIIVVAALAIWGSPDNAIVSSAMGQIGTILVAMIGALALFRVSTEAKTAAVEAKEVAQESKVATVALKDVAQEAKAAAVASIAASKENAQTLAVNAQQQATALEEQSQTLKEVGEKATKAADGVQVVKSIVDGWRTAMEQQNASLRASVEDLKVTLAHERAVTPTAPGVESPPVGATPPHGTPIVEIPPPESATPVPPKGKLPKVGDQS